MTRIRRRPNPFPLALGVKWLLSPMGPLLPPPPDLMTFLALRRSRKRNPGGRHLPRANARENRMYEHVRSAEVARGAPLREAKSIAAATVRAYQKRRRSRRT
jgi:hypothetical protein